MYAGWFHHIPRVFCLWIQKDLRIRIRHQHQLFSLSEPSTLQDSDSSFLCNAIAKSCAFCGEPVELLIMRLGDLIILR